MGPMLAFHIHLRNVLSHDPNVGQLHPSHKDDDAGNQVANLIVNNTGTFIQDSHGNSINPVGYQNVLYLTIVLYIVALLISLFMVRPLNKDGKKK